MSVTVWAVIIAVSIAVSATVCAAIIAVSVAVSGTVSVCSGNCSECIEYWCEY